MPPPSQRLIFVLLDGLRLDVAGTCMDYVQAEAVAAGRSCIPVAAELPSLSQSLYETLMTGVPPVCSGITGNGIVPLLQIEIAGTTCALMGVPYDGMSANPALL